MPLFFFTAFAGGLSAIDSAPDFDYPDYTTFQFVFVLIQSAIFGGVFTGFSVAADFEFGLCAADAARQPQPLDADRRLRARRARPRRDHVDDRDHGCGPRRHRHLRQRHRPAGLLLIAVAVNLAALLFATGVAMRLQTMQAGPLIQLPAFLIIFTAPVYVPRQLIEGWVAAVADYNPVTALLEAGRELVIGPRPSRCSHSASPRA